MDWRFEEQHPLLWDLAERSTVYANAPFDRHALIGGLMALELPNVSEHDLISHLDIPPTGTAPLGITLPAQLHDPVLTVFRQLGVPVLSAGSPRSLPLELYFSSVMMTTSLPGTLKSTSRSSFTRRSGFSQARPGMPANRRWTAAAGAFVSRRGLSPGR